MKLYEWALAFIVLSSIAVYMLLCDTRILELFTVRSKQAKCESSYQKCLEAGKDNRICTSYYNKCNLAITAKYNSPGNYQALQSSFNSYWNYKRPVYL